VSDPIGVLAAHGGRLDARGLPEGEERLELRDLAGAPRGIGVDRDGVVLEQAAAANEVAHRAAIVDVVLEALLLDAIGLLGRGRRIPEGLERGRRSAGYGRRGRTGRRYRGRRWSWRRRRYRFDGSGPHGRSRCLRGSPAAAL